MSALHYDQTHNIFVQLHGAPILTTVTIDSIRLNTTIKNQIATFCDTALNN